MIEYTPIFQKDIYVTEHKLLDCIDVEVQSGGDPKETIQYVMGVLAMSDAMLRLIEERNKAEEERRAAMETGNAVSD